MANLQQAIELFATTTFAEGSPDYGGTQMNQGTARVQLAAWGEEPVANLHKAIALYTTARTSLPQGSADYGMAQMLEGNARQALAAWGEEPVTHLQQAMALYATARASLEIGTPSYALTQMNEGIAWQNLAAWGEEPVTHLQQAIALHATARTGFTEGSAAYGRTHINEGNARQALAAWGEEPVANLHKAIARFATARISLPQGSAAYGRVQMLEGNARRRLAALGAEPVVNLQQAIQLYAMARKSLRRGTRPYALTQLNEGVAREQLAALGVEPVANLQQAIALYATARTNFTQGSPTYGRTEMNEANARQLLVALGVEPVAHLQQAIALYATARTSFTEGSPDYGGVLMNEGTVRMQLADLGENRASNLQQALSLYEMALPCLIPASRLWSIARSNQSHALRQLGRLHEAYQCLGEALAVVERVRTQMQREHQRRNFLETLAGHYANMVGICLDLVDQAPSTEAAEHWRWEAWHWVHRGKSRTLLELLAHARPRLTASDQPLWEEYERLAQALDVREREIAGLEREFREEEGAGRAFQAPAAQQARHAQLAAAWRTCHQAYVEKREEVCARIDGARSWLTVAVPPPQTVVQQLRTLAGLDTDAARKPLLVEFFTLSETEVVVFLVPLWGQTQLRIERIPLEHGAVLQLAVSLLNATGALQAQTRARCGHEAPPGTPADQQAAGQQVTQVLAQLGALVEPWAARLAEWQPTELVLAPHFLLNLLPLHAALWQGRPLLDYVPVVYLPSPALAGELVAQRKPLRGEALLLGNPTQDLGGAEAEVSVVAAEVQQRGLRPRPFVGDQATTARVHTHGPAAGLLHFAGHAALEAADFLRSGLELADRRLTALDVVARLDLQQSALVYLSSCDSGQSVPGRTDELLALVRVFLYAGAPTVMASLWAIDDDAGYIFATHFYTYWLTQQHPLAVAFQKAMQATRARFPSEPWYWAPFVLMGAWQVQEDTRHDDV